MLFSLIFLFIGLMIGWFFLPMPTWAKNLGDYLITKVPFLATFVKK